LEYMIHNLNKINMNIEYYASKWWPVTVARVLLNKRVVDC
jgi:hypothetical protein